MPERKLGFFVKIKEDENFNHSNTGSISRIKIWSLTQILAEKTVFVQALSKFCDMFTRNIPILGNCI